MYGFVPSLEMLVKTLHSVVGNIIFKTLYPNVLGVTKMDFVGTLYAE